MHHVPADFDALLIPPFSVYDGVEGAWQDDDRTVDLWSHYHANRVNLKLRLTRERIRIFEWQLADVRPRGHAERTAWAEGQLADAKAELSHLEHQRDLLEAARVKDSYAPREWRWE